VESPYAGPPEGVPTQKTTDRFYRGYCVTTPALAGVLDEYRSKRAQLMAIVANEPRLNDHFRSKATRFLQDFFDILDDPGKTERMLTKHCR
jgi:hypothetical protein